MSRSLMAANPLTEKNDASVKWYEKLLMWEQGKLEEAPSPDFEEGGNPLALLEAMAAGLAVIVTDASPGPLEVVEPGVSGLVVPSDDPDALAAAMASLASDPERCRRMSAAARARIASLDWPQLEPLWRSILALS